MSGEIKNSKSRYKLIFLIIISSLLFLCCFKPLYSAEQTGKDAEEIKNNVYNLYDREIGRVDKEGTVFSLYGRKIGSVDEKGIIRNISDMEIGKVESDGTVLNQSGTKLGSVNDKGEVFNISDRKVGSVKDISDIKLIGGAARLIIFR